MALCAQEGYYTCIRVELYTVHTIDQPHTRDCDLPGASHLGGPAGPLGVAGGRSLQTATRPLAAQPGGGAVAGHTGRPSPAPRVRSGSLWSPWARRALWPIHRCCGQACNSCPYASAPPSASITASASAWASASASTSAAAGHLVSTHFYPLQSPTSCLVGHGRSGAAPLISAFASCVCEPKKTSVCVNVPDVFRNVPNTWGRNVFRNCSERYLPGVPGGLARRPVWV